ncbi:hypothetical protein [Sporolactobacillus laevolacticus]|uniref:hypothetical protein n=1 Tax=Sporolactobacillus laevolacticus TaxID=33018 RepID=UPI0025B453AB|nr:hypothetical protein [Sporolactobacillus laevolacticus]MDN3956202.1 hypothetical protein [Sporolactobacillus laevolacticus]
MVETLNRAAVSKKFSNYPVYLNVITLNGRGLIKKWLNEEEIIKLVEQLCDDLVVYTKDNDGNLVELFDIATKSADGIYSLRTVIEQCEDGQFEDTLEILLDNSQE